LRSSPCPAFPTHRFPKPRNHTPNSPLKVAFFFPALQLCKCIIPVFCLTIYLPNLFPSLLFLYLLGTFPFIVLIFFLAHFPILSSVSLMIVTPFSTPRLGLQFRSYLAIFFFHLTRIFLCLYSGTFLGCSPLIDHVLISTVFLPLEII